MGFFRVLSTPTTAEGKPDGWRLRIEHDAEFGATTIADEQVLPERVFSSTARRILNSAGELRLYPHEIQWLAEGLAELVVELRRTGAL